MELSNEPYIRAFYYSSSNVGDALNYYLIKNISGKEVVLSGRDRQHYIVCGSILSEANENSVIWGAGFNWTHHKNQDLNGCKNVIAVRGDLSANQCGMEVKAIGDPALLLPKYFTGMRNPQHSVGVIPHWSNVERAMSMLPDRHIINPIAPMHDFINDILSCEYVFSESLHGLILSDAYCVPNAWINLGGDVGDGFKYRDYYSSTITPEATHIVEINIHDCQVHNYKYNLETFLKSCPFYGHDRNKAVNH